MVLFWARTPCASMHPSMDESRESSDKWKMKKMENAAFGRHIGPHLRNERTTEIWAYGRFYAKLGIYQYGRERWLRSARVRKFLS